MKCLGKVPNCGTPRDPPAGCKRKYAVAAGSRSFPPAATNIHTTHSMRCACGKDEAMHTRAISRGVARPRGATPNPKHTKTRRTEDSHYAHLRTPILIFLYRCSAVPAPSCASKCAGSSEKEPRKKTIWVALSPLVTARASPRMPATTTHGALAHPQRLGVLRSQRFQTRVSGRFSPGLQEIHHSAPWPPPWVPAACVPALVP